MSFLDRAKYRTAKLIYGDYPPTSTINYIWANQAVIGLAVRSPYTDRSIMIPVQSGNSQTNQWISERRNILEDYRRVFRTDPPMISGIAIMTDTDNTGEAATAYYGDIILKNPKIMP
jgi:hypothetical protein